MKNKLSGYTLGSNVKVGITFVDKDTGTVYSFKPKTKKVEATVVKTSKKISVLELGVERGFLIRLYEKN